MPLTLARVYFPKTAFDIKPGVMIQYIGLVVTGFVLLGITALHFLLKTY